MYIIGRIIKLNMYSFELFRTNEMKEKLGALQEESRQLDLDMEENQGSIFMMHLIFKIMS